MKMLVAIFGLGLLAFPLFRHLGFDRRLEGSKSVADVVSSLAGVSRGLTIGFFGLMTLGFLVDGGSGYRKPALLILMAVIGGLWVTFYPSGWMLGIPLIVYPLLRRLGFETKKAADEPKA